MDFEDVASSLSIGLKHHLSLQPNNGSSSSSSPRAPTKQSFFIGVARGTASRKTTVCNLIISQLRNQHVVLVNQDDFYHSLNEEKLKKVHEYNFDHPEASDTELLLSFLEVEALAGILSNNKRCINPCCNKYSLPLLLFWTNSSIFCAE